MKTKIMIFFGSLILSFALSILFIFIVLLYAKILNVSLSDSARSTICFFAFWILAFGSAAIFKIFTDK